MSDFKKWVEIENHYRQKYIDKFFTRFPQLYKEVFYISEKLDGSNFSIILNSSGKIQIAKRSGIMGRSSNFYGWNTVFCDRKNDSYNPTLIEFISKVMIDYVLKFDCTIQLVGELFGNGIQKRVNYGSGKYWRWFGTYKDGLLLSLQQEMEMIEELGLKWSDVFNIRVPQIDTFKVVNKDVFTFEDVLTEVNIKQNSYLTPEGYDQLNLMEGVVIRPYNNYTINHETFFIKYKNEEFFDTPKEKKPKKETPLEVKETLPLILSYVNENRTQDLFSKYGEIESPNQIGEYIKYYLEDLYSEFNKDFEGKLKDMDKDNFKMINKNLTTTVVKEFHKYL